MYRIVRIAIAALASVGMLASVAACGSGRSSSEKNGTIEVVASVNQWGTVAKTLGGGNVNVTSVINSTNVDAHDYEPTTSDIAKLQKAQVIIVNGAGYDAWAVKAAQSANATIVNAAAVGGVNDGENPHVWFAADGVLQHFRNGLDDDLTNLGDGDENVDQATQEHHAQGLLPGEAEAEANGVGEECVEAHAGGLSIRNVGEQAHDERARDGCDDGCKEHAAPRHSRLRQYLWVDDDDVRHCEERGQTGHDLSGHGGAVLLKMEELFHFSLSLFLLGW